MTIQEDLEKLRKETQGCTLSAFGDLSSSLILRSSSETRVPREKLDQLCVRAEKAFGFLDAVMDAKPTKVIAFGAQQTEVFEREHAGSDDVVCAVLDPACSINSGAQAVHAVVQRSKEA